MCAAGSSISDCQIPNQFVPDTSTQCHNFWQCTGPGTGNYQPCNTGLAFDTTCDCCNYPSSFTCGTGSSPGVPGSPSTVSTSPPPTSSSAPPVPAVASGGTSGTGDRHTTCHIIMGKPHPLLSLCLPSCLSDPPLPICDEGIACACCLCRCVLCIWHLHHKHLGWQRGVPKGNWQVSDKCMQPVPGLRVQHVRPPMSRHCSVSSIWGRMSVARQALHCIAILHRDRQSNRASA